MQLGLQFQVKIDVVDTRHVQTATGVTFFRVQGKRVAIHKGFRDVSVMLIRLNKTEVSTFTIESLKVVKTKTCANNGIAVLEAGEVEGVVGIGLTFALNGPHEF